MTGERDDGRFGRLRGDVMDMAHAIARTKAEIAAINAPDHDQSRLGGASAALDAIVLSTERATSDILGAAEQVQEAAWTLRESDRTRRSATNSIGAPRRSTPPARSRISRPSARRGSSTPCAIWRTASPP